MTLSTNTIVSLLLCFISTIQQQHDINTDMCLWGSVDKRGYRWSKYTINGLYHNSKRLYNNKPYYILNRSYCNEIIYLAYFDYAIHSQREYHWGFSKSLSSQNTSTTLGLCNNTGSTPHIACGDRGHLLIKENLDSKNHYQADLAIDSNAHIISNHNPNIIACPNVNCSSIQVVDTGSTDCSGSFHQIGYLEYTKKGIWRDIFWTFDVEDGFWSCNSWNPPTYGCDFTAGCCIRGWTDHEHPLFQTFNEPFSDQGSNYTWKYDFMAAQYGTYNAKFTCIGVSDQQYIMKPTNAPTSPTPTANTITSKPTSIPTSNPTLFPSSNPTLFPSSNPTLFPSTNPTLFPSLNPTMIPTSYPVQTPSINPTTLSPVTISTTYIGSGKISTTESNTDYVEGIRKGDKSRKSIVMNILIVVFVVIALIMIVACFRRFYRMNKIMKQVILLETENINQSFQIISVDSNDDH